MKTENKNSEKAAGPADFRLMIEASSDMICMHDTEGRYLYVSPVVKELLGYSPEEMTGRDPYEFFHAEDVNNIRENSHEPALAGQTVKNLEYRFRHRNGHYIWVSTDTDIISPEKSGVTRLITRTRDISEKKRTEAELQKTRSMLEKAQKIADIGSWSYDIVEEKAVWSEQMFRIFGLEPRDEPVAYGEHLEMIYPDDRPVFDNAVTRSITEGKPFDLILRIMGHDNSIRTVNIICHIDRDQYGNIVRLYGTMQNVTYILETDHKLRLFSTVIEQSPDSIIITDRTGCITYANPAFTQITGYSAEEVKGRNPRFLKSGRVNDETYRNLWQTITSGRIWRGRFINKKKDGSLYYENSVISPVLNPAGEIERYVAIKEDITDRLSAEKNALENALLVQDIMNATSEGIWIIDTERKTIDVNHGLEQLLGYSHHEMVGRPPVDFTDEENSLIFRKQTALIGKTAHRSYEIELRHKEGYNIPVLMHASTIRDSEGRISAAVAFVTDIRDQKKLQHQLEKRNSELFSSLEHEKVLMKELHHRVKNNMQTIASLLYRQQQSFSSDDIRYAFENSISRIKSMAAIHEQIYHNKDLNSINIGEHIRDYARQMVASYRPDNVHINLLLDTEDVTVSLDNSIPLALILNELIMNSLKYAFTEHQQPEIRISCRKESGTIEIKVCDNGRGLPEGFDIDEAETLGLYLVKNLVLYQLKGELQITPRNPTEFTIIFKEATDNE